MDVSAQHFIGSWFQPKDSLLETYEQIHALIASLPSLFIFQNFSMWCVLNTKTKTLGNRDKVSNTRLLFKHCLEQKTNVCGFICEFLFLLIIVCYFFLNMLFFSKQVFLYKLYFTKWSKSVIKSILMIENLSLCSVFIS